MFTGIVGGLATVRQIVRHGQTLQLNLQLPTNGFSDLKLGDSLSVDGVCLTSTRLSTTEFMADVMPETFRKTNLGQLQIGSTVNVERALAVDGRFEGHMVQGHVDGVGVIAQRRRDENAVMLKVNLPQALTGQVVTKGAITVDGVSLTVVDAQPTWFTVSLIPQTQTDTKLLSYHIGEKVNLEIDVIFRYLQAMTGANK
ncbi:riboflavin synthase [Furfurilactobacillus siliginis]|uniref:Riboflavin synthase n=1 Tax=Furfurilactobacillus siliginis TaxID=348151 RepID=A0A0R2LDE9_9LACO|nr:riboflavin synthase [Furfurilactobacillus siliginis]KRN97260.1 riboflavin synthase subunit alpha [Furfurilactobacillus siliginis]GEK29143.1 riboflavin synthase subunit alpha [Furfurilactobacillus siliginis]